MKIVYINENSGAEIRQDPPDTATNTLAALLIAMFEVRRAVGGTAFATAAAAATTAFDAKSLGIGTVTMLTDFGPQPPP